jgi:hypothetical protein
MGVVGMLVMISKGRGRRRRVCFRGAGKTNPAVIIGQEQE